MRNATRTALRVAREERGLTIRGLRAMTGIATGRLSMLERDMVKPSPSELERLAAALKAPVQQIYPAAV
jgi:transcriptional regulator with XRE-family HTH domain